MTAVSLSPTTTSGSFHDRFRANSTKMSIRQPKVLHPVDNEDLRLLILENISQEAVKAFESQGFRVDHHTKAMSEDELVQVIHQYHAIGIRSKTRITERVLKSAPKVRSLSLYYDSEYSLTRPCTATYNRLLLHWCKPSRLICCRQDWYPGLQLSILKFPFRRGARALRGHRSLAAICPAGFRDAWRHLE